MQRDQQVLQEIRERQVPLDPPETPAPQEPQVQQGLKETRAVLERQELQVRQDPLEQ